MNYEILFLEFGLKSKKNKPSEYIIGNEDFFIKFKKANF